MQQRIMTVQGIDHVIDVFETIEDCRSKLTEHQIISYVNRTYSVNLALKARGRALSAAAFMKLLARCRAEEASDEDYELLAAYCEKEGMEPLYKNPRF